jgi:hypothetical protein
MPAVFLNGNYLDHGNWRLTVVIPSTDRRLVYWPKYMRRAIFEMQTSEWLRREADRFFCYFGEVTRDRIRAVDHSEGRAEAAGAISNEERARMARAA